jgi:hypothetical protein
MILPLSPPNALFFNLFAYTFFPKISVRKLSHNWDFSLPKALYHRADNICKILYGFSEDTPLN